jgi:hypothetical protein
MKTAKRKYGRLNVRIAPADISAAHRLPKSEKQKFKPTIVHFKDRTQRMDVLKRRKILKRMESMYLNVGRY